MKRYEVIREAYQGDVRYVLSELVGVGMPLFQLTAYSPSDPQGVHQGECAVYTSLKDAETAMEGMGLSLIDVSTPLYSHAQYTGEDYPVETEGELLEAVA